MIALYTVVPIVIYKGKAGLCFSLLSIMNRFSSLYDNKSEEEDFINRNKELETMKLPGGLDKWTGTVMYPNEETQVWDQRKNHLLLLLVYYYVLESYTSELMFHK